MHSRMSQTTYEMNIKGNKTKYQININSARNATMQLILVRYMTQKACDCSISFSFFLSFQTWVLKYRPEN